MKGAIKEVVFARLENPTFLGKFKVNSNEKKCPKIKVKGHTWSYIVSKGQILFGGHFITFKDIV